MSRLANPRAWIAHLDLIGAPHGRRGAAALAAALIALAMGATSAQATYRIAADELERQLYHQKEVALDGKTVVGDFTFGGQSLTATDVIFAGKVNVASDVDSGELVLRETRFEEAVDLYLSRLGRFDCDGCEFAQDVTFHSLDARELWLVRTTFKGYSVFAAMTVDDVNLADAHFEKTADFGGAEMQSFNAPRLRADEPVLIPWDQFGDDWAEDARAWATVDGISEEQRRSRVAQVEGQFRFWKRNFTDLDQQLDAREANFQLIKLRREEGFKPLDPDYWIARILELGSRYGTRPQRPFYIALGVIVIFTLAYCFVTVKEDEKDGEKLPDKWRLPFAFAFSVQTFVPFLTLPGIKDRWKIESGRWLEPVEGVLGAVLFGLAAYSLSYLL
jgi:hypothetical protein